ncbi:MAG: hypothetical protein GY811_14380 [Myxococcales bacterium]|nr:hypothetical protein [Myxococcales bacterium]
MKQNLSIATALAMSLLVAPACSKDKKDGDKGETAQKMGGDSKAKGGDKGNSSGAAASGDIMSHFPANTEVVLALNMASLTGSKMWKQYGDAAMANAPKELGEFKETCGFDPVSTIQSVHMGINAANKDQPLIIVSGFARGKLTECVKKMAKKEGEKIEITEDGKFTFMSGDGPDKKTAIVWISDSTLMLVPNMSDKDYLQARLDGKDGLNGNADFNTAAGKAKQGAPIWFAASFGADSEIAAEMGAMGTAPKALYGSVGFTDGVDFALGVTFADAKSAEDTLNMAKPMLGLAKESLGSAADIVDKLKLATSGADMTVSLKLTDADVNKLKALAGQMLGSLGGP